VKQVDYSPGDVVEPMDIVSSTNQPPKQVDGAGGDEITLAFDTLTAAAAELGYSIHDLPRDGYCLFSAIAYQLEPIGIQSDDAQTLRNSPDIVCWWLGCMHDIQYHPKIKSYISCGVSYDTDWVSLLWGIS